MKRIAIALILFQLMGCAKSPVVTTRPEKKQEEVIPQHDTPQAPKTNYLKIGGAIVGILTILASIGLIAYCCSRRKEKSLEAKKIAEQDAKDIDRIVPKADQEIRDNYSDIGDFLLKTYINHTKYRGKTELKAILKWHFLQPLPKNWEAKTGETYLCRQREYVEYEVNREVRETRKVNPDMPMTEVFAARENSQTSFLPGIKMFLRLDQRLMRTEEEHEHLRTAVNLMNGIARLVYYDEFKNALIDKES